MRKPQESRSGGALAPAKRLTSCSSLSLWVYVERLQTWRRRNRDLCSQERAGVQVALAPSHPETVGTEKTGEQYLYGVGASQLDHMTGCFSVPACSVGKPQHGTGIISSRRRRTVAQTSS
ncbi:hypothetical protein DPEC_G00162260 [Dallia pectoralis]|uniref:Uncharacterized protein n=1 Tax=Dallia pectoralis TaxID=75939 RepID=A0ACC2GGT8_DALPE|nr:hypothetical protein DPEC_G00162260 [Dallia pectoralis]